MTDIDASIVDVTSAAAQSQPEAKAEIEGETQETIESPEGDKPEDDKIEIPKKIANKLSKQDRRIGKLTAEKQQMLAELETLRQKAAPKSEAKDDAPKEADYETYGEYLRAEARYAAKQELRETQAKQSEKQAEDKTKEWEAERTEALDDNAEEAKTAFADFDKVISTSLKSVELAPHVRRAFLEADNGAFALYALAKEGMLEDLNDMSPYKVAMTVARMEDKGIALSKKKTTNAPSPLSPSRGTGTASKDPTQMTDAEFNAWRRASIAKQRR